MDGISTLIDWESYGERGKRALAPILDSLGEVDIAQESDDRTRIINQIKKLPENLKQPLWDIIIDKRFFVERGATSIYEPFGRLVHDSGSESYFANAMARKLPDEFMDAIRIQHSNDPDVQAEREEQKLYYNDYFLDEANIQIAANASPFTYLSLKDELGFKATINWSQYTDQDLAETAHLSSYNSVFAAYDNFKDRTNAIDILKDQARRNPALIIDSYDDLKTKPYARSLVDAALASTPALYFTRYRQISSHSEFSALYASTPEAQAVLQEAALSRPVEFLTNFTQYKDRPFATKAIEQLGEEDPAAILDYANKIGPVYGSKYIEYAFAKDLNRGLSRLASGWLNLDYLPNFGSILANNFPAYLEGDHEPDNTLLVVNYLNYLHEEPTAKRFEAVSKLDAGGFYTTLTEGRSEAYTSTFNYLFNQFSANLAKEGKTLNTFLNEKPERIAELQPFLDGVSSFGRFPDLMKSMDTADKMLFVDTILTGNRPDISQIITLANLTRNLPKDDSVLPYIETKILHGFATASDTQTKDLYGVLGRWYAEEPGRQIQPENSAAFKNISEEKRYELPNFERVDNSLLFDKQNRNFQMHLFYNDADGVASYDYFHQRMKHEGWKESVNKQDGTIHFVKQDQGRTVNVYATIPHLEKDSSASDPSAAAKIKAEIVAQGGQLTFVAHRGHSYHVNETIDQLTGSEQIVYLGACGGTEYIASTLEKSPHADIIATSGEGTKFVNEPLLSDITNRILKGQSIEWKNVEQTVRRIGDQRAEAYMMPSQNMAAVFISKIQTLEAEDRTDETPASPLNNNFSNAANAVLTQPQIPPVALTPAPEPAIP